MKHMIYMAVIAMLLSACNSGARQQAEAKDTALAAYIPGDQNKAESPDGLYDKQLPPPVKISQFTPPQVTHADWDKKIIRTAEITLELKDYASYNQRLHEGLKAYGAYIVSEEQASSTERIANEVTIRVPVGQFDKLVSSFSGEGISLLQKKIHAEDVTAEAIDTRSRMESRKQVRDRYLQLLQQARNMKEVLEMQKEINSIQEDIESAAGRVGYLDHQSAYSTIHLSYFQYLHGATPQEGMGLAAQLKESFYSGIRALGNLLVLLVSIWPLLLAVLLVIRWMRRSKQPAGNKPLS